MRSGDSHTTYTHSLLHRVDADIDVRARQALIRASAEFSHEILSAAGTCRIHPSLLFLWTGWWTLAFQLLHATWYSHPKSHRGNSSSRGSSGLAYTSGLNISKPTLCWKERKMFSLFSDDRCVVGFVSPLLYYRASESLPHHHVKMIDQFTPTPHCSFLHRPPTFLYRPAVPFLLSLHDFFSQAGHSISHIPSGTRSDSARGPPPGEDLVACTDPLNHVHKLSYCTCNFTW